MSLLEVASVSAWYGQAQALWDVSLAVPEGQVAGVLGRNGAGKTTLLRAIAGLHPKVTGVVHMGGTVLSGARPDVIARSGFSLVREGARLYPQNVNISAAAALAGIGLDRTRVVIVADPTLTTHIVELEATGTFGRFTFMEDVTVSEENRKTGKLVAMAMVKSVRQLASTLVMAA